MSETLSAAELKALVQRVFQPTDTDRALAVLVDLPDTEVADNPAWKLRREMAAGWAEQLAGVSAELGLEIHLVIYRNPRMNPGHPRTVQSLSTEGVLEVSPKRGYSEP